MKKNLTYLIRAVLMAWMGLVLLCYTPVSAQEPTWKVGLAKRMITPKKSMWMAGYATRNKPSSGKIHDLWAKAIVMEDANGKQLVLISTDLLGIPREIAKNVCAKLENAFGLSRESIVLNSSHTHSAPVLAGALHDIYEIDEVEQEKIEVYSGWLVNELISVVKEALHNKKSARVAVGSGMARFQVNRRNNKESEITRLSALNGPSDYTVPIIKVMDSQGKLMALLVSYACHATVLDGYEWSGDYVGFAQLELENRYDGCQAMFFQGAGADQNPLPRKSLARARQYGKVLAAAVEQVVEDDEFRPLAPEVKMAFREIQLPLEKIADKVYFEQLMAKNEVPAYTRKWAKRMMGRMQKGEQPETSYPYPIQCVQLGDQLLFALGGELVVQYALDLKKVYGKQTIIFGYSNDVMAYIPSDKILEEGGYEGDTSQMVYGLPAKWQKGIEQRIITACTELYREVLK